MNEFVNWDNGKSLEDNVKFYIYTLVAWPMDDVSIRKDVGTFGDVLGYKIAIKTEGSHIHINNSGVLVGLLSHIYDVDCETLNVFASKVRRLYSIVAVLDRFDSDSFVASFNAFFVAVANDQTTE